MTLYNNYLVYPGGDRQETGYNPGINQIIDLNGAPLTFPLKNIRIIAYRVYKISSEIKIGEENRLYHLELVPVCDLEEINRSGV